MFDKRVIVNVQPPGEDDGATVESPTSHWPDGDNNTPRPAAVVVWKEDFGVIGA